MTFTATPANGFMVNTWSVDGTIVQTGGATYTLKNITANHAVLVTFTVLVYTITPKAGFNGTISPKSVQTVNSGGSVTFTATPNAGYAVNTWSVDGTVVQTGGATYTLSNITANHTVLVTFNYTGPQEQGDWWMFHHDPQHTGRSPFTGPSSPVKKWSFSTQKALQYSSPALGEDGTIYVGSQDCNLYAINPDGTQKWVFLPGNGIVATRPRLSGWMAHLYRDNRMYEHLFALNADGTEKWAFVTGGVNSSPVIAGDGTIYVGSTDDHLYALNPEARKNGRLPPESGHLLPGPWRGRHYLCRLR